MSTHRPDTPPTSGDYPEPVISKDETDFPGNLYDRRADGVNNLVLSDQRNDLPQDPTKILEQPGTVQVNQMLFDSPPLTEVNWSHQPGSDISQKPYGQFSVSTMSSGYGTQSSSGGYVQRQVNSYEAHAFPHQCGRTNAEMASGDWNGKTYHESSLNGAVQQNTQNQPHSSMHTMYPYSNGMDRYQQANVEPHYEQPIPLFHAPQNVGMMNGINTHNPIQNDWNMHGNQHSYHENSFIGFGQGSSSRKEAPQKSFHDLENFNRNQRFAAIPDIRCPPGYGAGQEDRFNNMPFDQNSGKRYDPMSDVPFIGFEQGAPFQQEAINPQEPYQAPGDIRHTQCGAGQEDLNHPKYSQELIDRYLPSSDYVDHNFLDSSATAGQQAHQKQYQDLQSSHHQLYPLIPALSSDEPFTGDPMMDADQNSSIDNNGFLQLEELGLDSNSNYENLPYELIQMELETLESSLKAIDTESSPSSSTPINNNESPRPLRKVRLGSKRPIDETLDDEAKSRLQAKREKDCGYSATYLAKKKEERQKDAKKLEIVLRESAKHEEYVLQLVDNAVNDIHKLKGMKRNTQKLEEEWNNSQDAMDKKKRMFEERRDKDEELKLAWQNYVSAEGTYLTEKPGWRKSRAKSLHLHLQDKYYILLNKIYFHRNVELVQIATIFYVRTVLAIIKELEEAKPFEMGEDLQKATEQKLFLECLQKKRDLFKIPAMKSLPDG